MSINPNKRTERRNRCFVPVESKRVPTFDQSQTFDISRHGIGFISPYRHHINEKIAIAIQLEADKDPVLIIGIVKWVCRFSKTEQYRIGMNYDEIISGSQSRLDQYFES